MRRKLKRGQIYTAHDGTNIFRQIESVQSRPCYEYDIDMHRSKYVGYVDLVYYWTNRGRDLHRCNRSTFIEWLRVRRARKTQKQRLRKL